MMAVTIRDFPRLKRMMELAKPAEAENWSHVVTSPRSRLKLSRNVVRHCGQHFVVVTNTPYSIPPSLHKGEMAATASSFLLHKTFYSSQTLFKTLLLLYALFSIAVH